MKLHYLNYIRTILKLLLSTYLHELFILVWRFFISPKLVNLQIAPDWRQALTLKKTIEEKITKGIKRDILNVISYRI